LTRLKPFTIDSSDWDTQERAARGTRDFKFEEAWLLWDECEAVVQDGWSKSG